MNTEYESNENPASGNRPDPMRTSRNGKIASLPRAIREEVNRRLEAHQSGPVIVAWLNAEPAVKEVLDRDFGGKPISRQNLSQWRRDGFQEWRYYEWAVVYLQKLAGDDAEPTDVSNQRLVAVLGRLCLEEFGAVLERSRNEGMSTEKRFKYLCKGIHQINAIRREDNRAEQIALTQRIAAYRAQRIQERSNESNQTIEANDYPNQFDTLIESAVALSPGFAGPISQAVANQGPVGPVKVNQSKKIGFHQNVGLMPSNPIRPN